MIIKLILVAVQTALLTWVGGYLMRDRPFLEFIVAVAIGIQVACWAENFGLPFWQDYEFDAYDAGVVVFLLICWLR